MSGLVPQEGTQLQTIQVYLRPPSRAQERAMLITDAGSITKIKRTVENAYKI